jgi:hypothetical protein
MFRDSLFCINRYLPIPKDLWGKFYKVNLKLSTAKPYPNFVIFGFVECKSSQYLPEITRIISCTTTRVL